jgi:hypothetical protein
MALTVETGAIVAAAESYISVTDADTYHSNRGNAAWAALGTEAKEQALRKAVAYIDGKYYHRWKGVQVEPLTQTLQYPRAGVKISSYQPYYSVPPSFYDVDYAGYLAITTIPDCLKYAQCEAALRAAAGDLAGDLQDGVKSKSIAGAISTTYSGTSGEAVKKYPVIDMLLAPLLKSSCDLERG